MSRRLAVLAALAVVLGCAGCNANDLTSAKATATSAGDQLTSTASKQLEQKKAEATAAARKRAADLAAQAQQALQQQIAAAVKAAADKAVQQAVQAAASAAASAAPSPAAVVAAAPVPLDATHTLTGTFTSPQVVDVSGGSVPCATETNVVGQQVSVHVGTDTVTGVLTACTWSAPGVLGSSPVFALEVQKVPEASSYDISIGDRTWQVSGSTLAASGWQVALT